MSNCTPTKKVSLIATLPKSGTWYSHAFFWCYDQLLQNPGNYLKGKFRPDLENALQNNRIRNQTTHTGTLGIDKLHICHSICPGFHDLEELHRQRWEALHFPVTGYNWAEKELRYLGEWDLLNPKVNPQSKIVYLYRNPLDHFVSYFRHSQSHVDDSHRFKYLASGSRLPITNIHDFVFSFGALSAFIKHYYTFKQMQLHFPNNIMMMPYEHLTANPKQIFHQILSFLGAAPDNPTKLKLLKDSVDMCSKESLMKIESKMNKALGNDQFAGERHIRGGETGKWKSFFSEKELIAVEMALRSFKISLNDFILSDRESSHACLPWLSSIENEMYKTEFFDYQLEHASNMSEHNEYKREIGFLEKKIKLANENILLMTTSRSWKITAPLRVASNLFKRIRGRQAV